MAALAAEVVVDAVTFLPPAARAAWLGAVAVGAAWAVAAFVVRPALRRLDAVRIAAEIETRHPELGERLESAAELWAKRNSARLGYSVELIDALIEKAVAESAGIDFAKAGGDIGVGRWGRVLGATVAASAVALALTGARLGPAVERLARPLAADDAPRIVIEVEPGDARLVSGEELAVTARVRRPDTAPGSSGRRSPAPGPPLRVRGRGARARSPCRRRTTGRSARCSATCGPRSGTLVAAGGETSRRFKVEVIDRPFVAGIRLDYEFPRYSGLLPRTVDESNGDITALAGTRVAITVTASKPLDRADLVFGTGATAEARPRRTGRLPHDPHCDRERDLLHRDRATSDGLSNPDPASWSIVAVRDEYPLVRIVEPGEDRTAPSDMVLPIAVSAVDDYGISRLVLRYSIDGTADEGVLAIADPGARGPREVAPGDDSGTSPRRARSRARCSSTSPRSRTTTR